MVDYSRKLITVDQALGMVKSGDILVMGMAAAEPYEFLMNLHRIADRVQDVTITNCLPTIPGEYLSNPDYFRSFRVDSWFYTPLLRQLQSTGRVSFIPNNLHFAGAKRLAAVHPNLLISSASMPDEEGRVYFSCSNVYEAEIARAADLVMLEISPNIPRIRGENFLYLDEVDYLIQADYYLPEIADAASNEKDRAIGHFIAEHIQDGDCLQIGIGGIPNAVCEFLNEKHDLGIHTEMMTTGIMRLMRAGNINNSKKQVDVGKSVCCFALGTQELYAYCHENPLVEIGPGSRVNDPYIIAQNHNQVSINTTIEVDLTGQCCSESIGHVQYSGTGGQSDTAVGAQISQNGRSFIALYSTAMVKNPQTGGREEVSKIVPFLKPGAAVSLSRNDVDFVVTEYGCVRLKGLPVSKRCEALISIAHPKYRDELREAARQYSLWV
ncbi:MAG: 4-hydroxybutyrate--acetyl-CoA CoA transferase [Oscillospiraceae bacterium]|nr:4-hydroxybutyrate--acetyl-CoA CoA transferase [Oscillospiraceae bacterium]